MVAHGNRNIIKLYSLTIILLTIFVTPSFTQSLSIESLRLDKIDSLCIVPDLKLDYALLSKPKAILNIESTKNQSVMVKKFDYLKAYHDHLGIFCKAENIASQKATVNLRMRLGSLEYVDRMEGKIR